MRPSHSHFRLGTLGVTALLALAAPAAFATTVLVDFGDSDGTPDFSTGWNVISDAIAGTVADAVDDGGSATGIGIAITSRFNGTNNNGINNGTAPYQDDASKDSFYGNTAEFSGATVPNAVVELSGLNTGLTYDFTFYAARSGVGDNRETLYTLTGTNSLFDTLNAANNVSSTVTISGIAPTGGGTIELDVRPGPANNNGFGFYYLGALEINSVPEPGSALFLLGSLGLLAIRRRR